LSLRQTRFGFTYKLAVVIKVKCPSFTPTLEVGITPLFVLMTCVSWISVELN
jgi:hypothetical protein